MRNKRRQPKQTLLTEPSKKKYTALFALFIGLAVGYAFFAESGADATIEQRDGQPALLKKQPAKQDLASQENATSNKQAKRERNWGESVQWWEGADKPFGPSLPADYPNTIAGSIEGSLYASFQNHFGDSDEERLSGQILAAHFKRLFFFDVNFKRDLRKGDTYALVWERTEESTDGFRILAARFYSSLHDKEFTAYYFKDPADRFARHYNKAGESVQVDLKNHPMPDYEQVTALLNDRYPRHLGYDFKAPVGTKIVLPYDARVIEKQTRIARGNGRWLKVRYIGKNLDAFFLHLDAIPKSVRVGKRLKAGSVIADSGNTGRSTAPHLHYQVQRPSGRVLDPIRIHGGERRSISKEALASFKAQRAQYDAFLPNLNMEQAGVQSARN